MENLKRLCLHKAGAKLYNYAHPLVEYIKRFLPISVAEKRIKPHAWFTGADESTFGRLIDLL